jgi:hypothetical protein
MGVRCDRDELSFFPNIYNEDWFFFSDEAARHKIAEVGASKQEKYDPFENPQRAVKEEFGDLLAEGLYARLDTRLGVLSADIAYWSDFIQIRKAFLGEVADSLTARLDQPLSSAKEREVRAAQISIREARLQLDRITPELCQKFIDLWQADLAVWHRYLATLQPYESVEKALDHLRLDYSVSSLSTR